MGTATEPDSNNITPELFLSDSENEGTSMAQCPKASDVVPSHRFQENTVTKALVEAQEEEESVVQGQGKPGKSTEVKIAASNRKNLNRLKDNDITRVPPPWSNITTVMMRNLPNR